MNIAGDADHAVADDSTFAGPTQLAPKPKRKNAGGDEGGAGRKDKSAVAKQLGLGPRQNRDRERANDGGDFPKARRVVGRQHGVKSGA